MEHQRYIVIYFDSTFTKVEAMDVLGEIFLEGKAHIDESLNKIIEITNKGMNGSLSFRESLQQRVALLEAKRDHLPELINRLKQLVSNSFQRNKAFFEEHADNIFIISNGFKEFIVPIVKEYGIKEENVFANTFTFDESGNIVGFDDKNVLSVNNGKVEQLKSLNLVGDVYDIGGGYTDYESLVAGLANKFFAFTENIARENVLPKANHITHSIDEFLYLNKMNTTISYPKNRINVLLLENVHEDAVKLMKQEGYNVEVYPAGLDEDELSEKIKNVSILGIRSKTQVTAKVLENANRLIALGAFCIG